MYLAKPPKADAPPRLSVVVPCYNEEEVLPICAERLGHHLRQLVVDGKVSGDSHILFVDDGSKDGTWSLVQDLNRRSDVFRGIKLSRNRGHQSALMAGILSAEGDIVISVDADLQDDLAVMEQMVAAYGAGAEIVLGVRRSRATDTRFKRGSASVFYRLLDRLGVATVPHHADYRLLGRRAIEGLRLYGETNLYLRALILELGFTTTTVVYDRAERAAGTSKYPLRKMVALALEGVTSFSTTPLRLIAAAGFLIAAASFLMGGWAVLSALVLETTVPGWASLMVSIYFVCGVQMIALGIIGEYVGKIYLETKRRPRFLVEQSLARSAQRGPAYPIEGERSRVLGPFMDGIEALGGHG
jgi:polyisoprenyl-phosphate glycosyltransferase